VLINTTELSGVSIRVSPLHAMLRFVIMLGVVLSRAMANPVIVCDTTVKVGDGHIRIELWPEKAPVGVQRFIELVKDKFFDNLPMFRAIPHFLIQFGIQPDITLQQKWQAKGTIKDDPSKSTPFTDGIVSFAGYGEDSRSTHLFLTLGNQPGLGKSPWEVPVGKVVGGMDVMHGIYTGYGDTVDQSRLHGEHAAGYWASFPQLDSFKKCVIEDASKHVEI